jgi:CO/xanthine dehydrogenase FAD-binding subunit
MITEYYRPETMDEAMALITRQDKRPLVIAGGLYINEVIKDPIEVVDIQELGLSGIKKKGKTLEIGTAATLQELLISGMIPQALEKAILHQESYNRRQVATTGGSVVATTGRSPVGGVLLALDAELDLVGAGNKKESIKLGDFLPLRQEKISGKLIVTIQISVDVAVSYHYVARSPADLPIVAAAVAVWPAGRTRVVLMGIGDQPVMVFDGSEGEGAEIAAKDAFSEASDQWAGSEYRSAVAGALVKRCFQEIEGNTEG